MSKKEKDNQNRCMWGRLPREVYAGWDYLEQCMCDHMIDRCACETWWLWETYAVHTDDISIPYPSATSKLCNDFSSLPPTLYINIMTPSKSTRVFGVFLLYFMCSPIPWLHERYWPLEETLTRSPYRHPTLRPQFDGSHVGTPHARASSS
jgi:hypothetical protein